MSDCYTPILCTPVSHMSAAWSSLSYRSDRVTYYPPVSCAVSVFDRLLGTQELSKLAASFRTLQYKDDDVILQQGEVTIDYVYLVWCSLVQLLRSFCVS